jgi:tripartite-type tricarboxylate transporter receptor subunit TctC
MTMRRSLLAAAVLLPALPRPGLAQILPGGRQMRWVVPFPPGGAADAIARIWADAVTSRTGQAVVVENRGGANGILGVQAVAQGAADGSVLGVLNVSFFAALPLMMARPPYDPARDLRPVTRLVTSTVLCCVTAERARQRGWTDFRALVQWAKLPGHQLTKGSASNGGPAHLLIATIARRSGADILHVPYRGGAPALNDLLSGQIDMVFDFMPALMPHVAAGRLVPLTVGSRERSPLMPEVPGLGEFADLGIGDLDLQSWNALAGPGGLPDDLARQIATGIGTAAGAPGLAGRLATAGLVLPPIDTPAETAARIAADAPRWREMVEVSGARIE